MPTYAITDARTGRLLTEAAPFLDGSVAFSGGLGLANGTWTGDLDRGTLADTGLRWADLIAGRRRLVWPLNDDGYPMCPPYWLTANSARFGQARVQTSGPRCDEILAHREIRSTLVFNNVDQLDMVRDIVRYALGRPTTATAYAVDVKPAAADLPWWRLDAGVSGVRRDRLDNSDGFQGGKAEKAHAAIGRLLALIDGPEWGMVAGRDDDGALWVRSVLGYPRLGRPADESGLVFAWPGNIRDGGWGEDSSDTLTATAAHGATPEGAAAPITRTSMDDQAHAYGWPLLEEHLADDSVTEAATLQSQSDDMLRAYAGPNPAYQVVLDLDDLTGIADGDSATLSITEDWGVMQGVQRVVGWSADPTGGTCTPVLSDGWD